MSSEQGQGKNKQMFVVNKWNCDLQLQREPQWSNILLQLPDSAHYTIFGKM